MTDRTHPRWRIFQETVAENGKESPERWATGRLNVYYNVVEHHEGGGEFEAGAENEAYERAESGLEGGFRVFLSENQLSYEGSDEPS